MNFGDNRAFADNIYSKFRWDSQYQAEFVLDKATHPKYLQSILLEYYPTKALEESTIFKYFQE